MERNLRAGVLGSNKEKQRSKLYQLLGKLPPRNRPLTVEVVSTRQIDELWIETLLLDVNGLERVPAYFTKPLNQTGSLPVILFNHSHFGQYGVGKEEYLQGREEMQFPPYALALGRAGYAGLCIDNWCFGQRQEHKEEDTFKSMLWHGQVLWGMMVYDNLRALDYLQTRSDVDTHRLATMGMSMGSTMAWWLAALDDRIKVCVDLCCLTDYQALIEANGLGLHSLYYYVPDLLTHFTTAKINALISPRAHLSIAGRLDPLTPLAGLERIDQQLKIQYQKDGAPTAWDLRLYDAGHQETAEMRADIMAFYRQWLEVNS